METSQPAPAPKLSLARLSTAFAKLMSPMGSMQTEEETENPESGARLSPKMLIECMLFVGDNEGKPITADSLAGPVRDVASDEVEALIAELNEDYRQAETVYEIVGGEAGYRMQLRPEFAGLRDRFRGEAREAKLTPVALEVLSIVAYRQPLSSEQVSKLRGTKSHAVLASLVRRDLLSVQTEEPEVHSTSNTKRSFVTTERFNQLFGISSPAQLPKTSDHADR